MLAIRVTDACEALFASSGALLVVLGQRLDLGKDREPNQSDQGHSQAVDVQEAAPRLAQEHDAEHHQPDGAGFQILCAQLSKRHFLIAPKVTPRSRCLRSRKVKIATGRRNMRVPAAMAVQSVTPDPSCDGI